MEELKLAECENINGVDFVGGLCAAATVGSLVALTNFWNPVGWVAATLVVVDIGCVAYTLSQ